MDLEYEAPAVIAFSFLVLGGYNFSIIDLFSFLIIGLSN